MPTSPKHRPASRALAALPFALLALSVVACSSDDSPPAPSSIPAPDAAADSLAVDSADDAAPDVSPSDSQTADSSSADSSLADSSLDAPETGTDASAVDSSVVDSMVVDSTVDAGVAQVHYVGRYDDSKPPNVRFAWPGTGFVVRFKGTGVHVTMDDPSGYFTVVVDKKVMPRLETSKGAKSYTLASGLANGEHVVEVYRRVEGNQGATVVSSVKVDGLLLPPSVPSRRLEVIGDSITCGYGNEGANKDCHFTTGTENHYLTYGAIAARNVGAELSTIAYSGKGIVFNYGDEASSKVEPLPALYARYAPNEASPLWKFSVQPDAVLINLGTNDFSTSVDPTEKEFIDAYLAFFKAIRSKYPKALILSTIAPLLGGDDYKRASTYTVAAIERRNTDGDKRVKWIDLSATNDGFGCDWHPSKATHEAMGSKLTTILKQELGW